MMIRPRPIRAATRSPRVALRGTVSATIHLENQRVLVAKLHQLSMTGGLLEVATYLEERIRITLAFQLNIAPLLARAEMLFPMRGGMGYLQPFRFTAFGAGVRQTLEMEIAALLKSSLPLHSQVESLRPEPPAKAGHGTGLRLPRFFVD
ncbi:MAG TPA: hypothetical protein VKQ11_12580 [Candidatus Sulfotelmatobacter sp.]|nr:hypothetical protein [Candidatus Sulfotelmatobacter sp.]